MKAYLFEYNEFRAIKYALVYADTIQEARGKLHDRIKDSVNIENIKSATIL